MLIPQPNRHALLRSAASSTLAHEISATTVYSEKVLVPMKWYKVWPLHEKRLVPSGITPLPCVLRMAGQRLVFFEAQKMQSAALHSGV